MKVGKNRCKKEEENETNERNITAEFRSRSFLSRLCTTYGMPIVPIAYIL